MAGRSNRHTSGKRRNTIIRNIESIYLLIQGIRMKTFIIKSLLPSLYQREEIPPLWQRGVKGDFSY
jgi:hypothetical protein